MQIEKQAVEHESMAHFLHAYLVLRLKTLHHIRYHVSGCGGVTANLGIFSPFKQFENVFCERNLLSVQCKSKQLNQSDLIVATPRYSVHKYRS